MIGSSVSSCQKDTLFSQESISDNEPSLSYIDLESIGRVIYQQNNFYRVLSNFMEHPEFKPIVNEYFDSYDNIKILFLYVNLYRKIGDQFPKFNGYQKLTLVKTLIENSDTRQLICKDIRNLFDSTQKKLMTIT